MVHYSDAKSCMTVWHTTTGHGKGAHYQRRRRVADLPVLMGAGVPQQPVLCDIDTATAMRFCPSLFHTTVPWSRS